MLSLDQSFRRLAGTLDQESIDTSLESRQSHESRRKEATPRTQLATRPGKQSQSMLRSSEDNTSHGPSSSPEQLQVQFVTHVENVGDDGLSRAHITDDERAQIWAALSMETSKTSSLNGGTQTKNKISTTTADLKDADGLNKTRPRSDTKTKRFGRAFKKIFMNEQVVDYSKAKNRRDSWDDIYRNKDAAKIRPIHEEYGVL